jgi:hypothetical protein
MAAPASIGLEGLLALQQDPDPRERDRRAHAGGVVVLDLLTDLHRAFLFGTDPAATLTRLDGALADLPAAADPRLRGVLAEIVTRARIEAWRAGRRM